MTLTCTQAEKLFEEYLDGTLTGVEMAAIATHLEACAACAGEFGASRVLRETLGGMRVLTVPGNLQAQIRSAVATERVRGTHLGVFGRLSLAWERTLAPLAGRVAAAGAMAVMLAAGVIWMFGTPLLAVQANDDRLAHMVAPRYLYSQMTPEVLAAKNDAPVVIDATVDARGRVYDFAILEGPQDAALRTRLQANLLASVFKPATVFGVPVRGHVLLTFMGVSVRG